MGGVGDLSAPLQARPPAGGRIAFLGLGSMGGRMAARLVSVGHEVTVWNRTPEKATALADLGARVAASPAGACDGADLVITMLTDARALDAVVKGPQGVAAGMPPGTTLAEMSTVGARAVTELASALTRGVVVLDAPVLGSLVEAEEGRLTLLVGGPADLVERWRPTLSSMGEVVHVGVSGTGAVAKLVANAALFGVLGVLGETVSFARGAGLSDEQLFAVLDRTVIAEQAARRRPAIRDRAHPARFALALARKDADLAMEAAGDRRHDLPILQAAQRWLALGERSGRGASDYTAVLAEILAVPASSPVRSSRSTAGRTWGDSGRAWDLVDRPGCRITEEAMGPATAERWHVHDSSRQFFYVLSGSVTVRTPASVVELDEGAGREIDPGTPHQIANRSGRDVRFLVISWPSIPGDRRDLGTPDHSAVGPGSACS